MKYVYRYIREYVNHNIGETEDNLIKQLNSYGQEGFKIIRHNTETYLNSIQHDIMMEKVIEDCNTRPIS